jgi:hypothetical protein
MNARDYVIVKRDGDLAVRQWRNVKSDDKVFLSDPLACRARKFSGRAEAEAVLQQMATAVVGTKIVCQ